MKTMLKNPFLVGHAVIYVIFLLSLSAVEGLPIGESLLILFIIGLGFSGIAFWLTRSVKAFSITARANGREMWMLFSCIVFVTVYLTWGKDAINNMLAPYSQDSPSTELILNSIQKIIIFVIIPLFLFQKIFGYSLRDFGLQIRTNNGTWKKHLGVFLGMGFVLILFQYVIGGAAAPIREGQFTAKQLIFGMPIAFLWLCLEVGLGRRVLLSSSHSNPVGSFFRVRSRRDNRSVLDFWFDSRAWLVSSCRRNDTHR